MNGARAHPDAIVKFLTIDGIRLPLAVDKEVESSARGWKYAI
jgi:hypothetical protein